MWKLETAITQHVKAMHARGSSINTPPPPSPFPHQNSSSSSSRHSNPFPFLPQIVKSMAAKFALAASLLVALVALSAATTTYTTVVTTSVEDEANQGDYRRCQQQIQGRRFNSCQRYLSQRSPFNGEDDEEEFELAGVVVDDEEENQQQGSLRECCRELRNVNEPCQCAAIRQAARQLQEGRGSYGEMGPMQRVYQKARNLPQRCGLRTRQCQIRAVFV